MECYLHKCYCWQIYLLLQKCFAFCMTCSYLVDCYNGTDSFVVPTISLEYIPLKINLHVYFGGISYCVKFNTFQSFYVPLLGSFSSSAPAYIWYTLTPLILTDTDCSVLPYNYFSWIHTSLQNQVDNKQSLVASFTLCKVWYISELFWASIGIIWWFLNFDCRWGCRC